MRPHARSLQLTALNAKASRKPSIPRPHGKTSTKGRISGRLERLKHQRAVLSAQDQVVSVSGLYDYWSLARLSLHCADGGAREQRMQRWVFLRTVPRTWVERRITEGTNACKPTNRETIGSLAASSSNHAILSETQHSARRRQIGGVEDDIISQDRCRCRPRDGVQ